MKPCCLIRSCHVKYALKAVFRLKSKFLIKLNVIGVITRWLTLILLDESLSGCADINPRGFTLRAQLENEIGNFHISLFFAAYSFDQVRLFK